MKYAGTIYINTPSRSIGSFKELKDKDNADLYDGEGYIYEFWSIAVDRFKKPSSRPRHNNAMIIAAPSPMAFNFRGGVSLNNNNNNKFIKT